MARNFGLKSTVEKQPLSIRRNDQGGEKQNTGPPNPWFLEAVIFVCTAALIVAVELLILMVVR